jgi:DNA-binding FadR family transcriptional regulator
MRNVSPDQAQSAGLFYHHRGSMAYSLSWIKLWIEILDDPKMGQLSDHAYRRAIELFLLAGRAGLDGILPDVRSIAWTFRATEESILADLQALARENIVTQQESGEWVVTNFSKRQSAASTAQRVAEYRARKKECNETLPVCNESCNDDVTNVSESESVSESIKEGEKDEFQDMQALIEEMTGYPLPNNPDEVKAVNEFVAMRAGRDDFTAALAFLKGKKVVRGACDLMGSVRYGIAKRTQAGNAAKTQPAEMIASEVYG